MVDCCDSMSVGGCLSAMNEETNEATRETTGNLVARGIHLRNEPARFSGTFK